MQATISGSAAVGRRVRTLRQDLGLEIQEAAEKAGVSKQTWSRVENGHDLPRGSTAQKMADALGVNVATVWDDNSPEPLESNRAAVAVRIRQLRQQTGLQVREAAEKAGVAPETWSRIENGHYMPRSDTLGKMANALGVSPPLLMSPDDMAPRDSFETTMLGLVRNFTPEMRERAIQALATMAIRQ